MGKNLVEVKGQEAGQHTGAADAQDVHLPGPHNGFHRLVKGVAVRLLHGAANLLAVQRQHPGENVAAGNLFVDNIHPLNGGEAVADNLLEVLLELGVTLKAYLGGKAHHCRFADPHRIPQLGGGHKGSFIVVLGDEAADELLPLGKTGHIPLNHR